MIEVKIGETVYAVTDSSSYEEASRAMAAAWREECIARAHAIRVEREKAMLADGWVPAGTAMVRWERGTWETFGTSAWGIVAPVPLWVRDSPKNKWHAVPAGHGRSQCSMSVGLYNGREVSAVEPLAGVCLQCVKRGAS
jgi:hypothetical protein